MAVCDKSYVHDYIMSISSTASGRLDFIVKLLQDAGAVLRNVGSIKKRIICKYRERQR